MKAEDTERKPGGRAPPAGRHIFIFPDCLNFRSCIRFFSVFSGNTGNIFMTGAKSFPFTGRRPDACGTEAAWERGTPGRKK